MAEPGDLPSVSTPIGKAKRLSLECFIDQVLPPLPCSTDLDGLIEEGAFQPVVTKQGKVWGYTKQPPSGIHKKDVKRAFAHLPRGVRSIARTVRTTSALPLFFLNNKEGQADLSLRKYDTLPDAYFVLEPSLNAAVEWANIAAFGEYQREEDTDSVEENVRKVVYSMENCMRMDPRRRFVYAFTIEDTAMKLWYCDRAQVLVSEPFNFIEDYRHLIYFVAVISLARRDQLGWDPTVISRIEDGKRQYDIQVCSADGICTQYRTLELLWSHGARRAMSKGTRVWKAMRIEKGMPTGDPVAVKDAWVDSTRDREGYVYSRVMQSDFLSKGSPRYQRAFTTIQAHGDVWMEDEQDTTLCFHDTSDSSGSFESSAEEISSDEATSYSPHPYAAIKDGPRFQAHYRVVYGEVGQPLSDLTSLRVIFEKLADTVKGLSVMHKSRWVHRDVSLGNILVVDGVARLSDLEYATCDTEQKELGRTGTAYFVAVEVEERDYLFAPCPRSIYIPEDDPYRVIIIKEQQEFPFRYNPLHDLESVWWIAVYLIICREIDDDTEQKPWRTDNIAQVQAAHDYFYKRHERKNGFLNDSNFYGRISSLHPRMKKVGFVLDKIRMMLRDTYEVVETSVGSITFDVATRMYDPFCHLLRAAADVAGDIRIRRFSHTGGSGS